MLKQLRFIKMCIENGYIAEDYSSIVLGKYTKFANSTDLDFVNNISCGVSCVGHKLVQPQFVVNEIELSKYKRKCILNFDLVKFLIDNYSEAFKDKRNAVVELLSINDIDVDIFIIDFLNKNEYIETSKTLIVLLIGKIGIFRLLSSVVPDIKAKLISHIVNLTTTNYNFDFYKSSELFAYIEHSTEIEITNLKSVIALYKKLGMKLHDISPYDENIVDEFVKNNLLLMTMNNLTHYARFKTPNADKTKVFNELFNYADINKEWKKLFDSCTQEIIEIFEDDGQIVDESNFLKLLESYKLDKQALGCLINHFSTSLKRIPNVTIEDAKKMDIDLLSSLAENLQFDYEVGLLMNLGTLGVKYESMENYFNGDNLNFMRNDLSKEEIQQSVYVNMFYVIINKSTDISNISKIMKLFKFKSLDMTKITNFARVNEMLSNNKIDSESFIVYLKSVTTIPSANKHEMWKYFSSIAKTATGLSKIEFCQVLAKFNADFEPLIDGSSDAKVETKWITKPLLDAMEIHKVFSKWDKQKKGTVIKFFKPKKTTA